MNKFVQDICFIVIVLFIPLAGISQTSTGNLSEVNYRPQAAVASAHPLATQVGIDILQQGGNAFDAAIAVTAALAVVEPYSSGIGGGGFYLLHQAANDRYVMLDARERAPYRAHKDMYLDDKQQVKAGASITGPLSAGIPGIPAALVHLAQNYGKLKLSQSLAPAIKLATDGFEVDEYYQRMARFRLADLQKYKAASAIFLQQGKVPELHHKIIQKDLANTLQKIADDGFSGFYENELAWQMVKDVRKHGGIWTLKDLASYEVKLRSPDTVVYKGMKLVSASLP
jgi:gamma-glutamyltranspeptidase/glutathione hydrolase